MHYIPTSAFIPELHRLIANDLRGKSTISWRLFCKRQLGRRRIWRSGFLPWFSSCIQVDIYTEAPCWRAEWANGDSTRTKRISLGKLSFCWRKGGFNNLTGNPPAEASSWPTVSSIGNSMCYSAASQKYLIAVWAVDCVRWQTLQTGLGIKFKLKRSRHANHNFKPLFGFSPPPSHSHILFAHAQPSTNATPHGDYLGDKWDTK